MTLELTAAEAVTLYAVLDRQVSAMYAEISHTDNPAFRRGLREERDLLRGIKEQLSSQTAAAG